MDKIQEILAKLTGDDGLMESFKKDPMGTVKGLAGDLPEVDLQKIVDAIKAKIDLGDKAEGVLGDLGEKAGDVLENLEEAAGGVVDKIKGLFGK